MINDVWKEKSWIVPKIEETFNLNRTTLILYTEKILKTIPKIIPIVILIN